MKTIGWGIIQIPLVSNYRFCFCIKKELSACVTGTGWKLFLQSTLRLILLVVWGMQNIDYSYPQSHEKVKGVYVEIAILCLQIFDGLLTVFAKWFKSFVLLYPVLVVIPLSFLVDFFIRATCYASLFLWPQVTTFGIFSLIEIWFRYLGLMYCWITIISFIHTSKHFADPFTSKRIAAPDDNDAAAVPAAPASRRESSTPFSRSLSLSRRGRRSFLLRHKPDVTSPRSPDDVDRTERGEPEGFEQRSPLSRDSRRGDDDDESTLRRPSESIMSPSAAAAASRPQRKGGFVPDILRRGSCDDLVEVEGGDDDVSLLAEDQKHPPTKPPHLPTKPPAHGSLQALAQEKWKNFRSSKNSVLDISPSTPLPSNDSTFQHNQSMLV